MRWRPTAHAVWWTSAVLTALNGLLVGAGSVWFQLFGEDPDRGDYLVSAGGYLTAGAVLVVGLAAVADVGVARVAAWSVLAVAAALLLAGMGSLQNAADLPPHNRPSAGVLDGIGGVIALPWAWALVWLGARGLLRRRVR